MSQHTLKRRTFVAGAAGFAGLLGADLLLGCASRNLRAGATNGIGYFDRFGINEGLIREALAAGLSKGGDFAELFFQHRVSENLVLEDGEVNRGSAEVELGVGVRVLSGDQTGYAYTEDLSLESIRRAAQTAAAVANGPSRAVPERFHIESKLPQHYPMRGRWDEVPIANKLPLLTQTNADLLSRDPRIKKARISFGNETGVILIADSTGRIVEDVQPMTNLNVNCVAEHKGRREENGQSIAARAGMDLYTPDQLKTVVSEAVERTLILFEAAQPPAGEMPVVLAAGDSGILLHEAIGHGMEADFNRKGHSVYADKLGKNVAKPFVNIVDDGTNEAARGALNVDDEGNVTERTALVQNGVLTTYLHDTVSARHYKVKPTGNGRRENYRHTPYPRMRSTYMLNGPHKKDEVIASVKRGIYCQTFTNGQVDIGPGDFSFYVKNGYLIEDGKLTRPIKDVNLIGNGPKVLENIDMVADDLRIDNGYGFCGKEGQLVPVSMGLPTVRVASLTVGGRNAKG
jgi:TldD protein